MMTQCLCRKVVVFDLDDTLYKEIDFLRSGYRAIVVEIPCEQENLFEQMMLWYEGGENVFQNLCRRYPTEITMERCLEIYRWHIPDIALDDGCKEMLSSLKEQGCILGFITDGREITQRNKIKALGLEEFISWDDIVISESFGSEKPDERNYRYFMERYPDARYVYVADNVKKDFIAPNRLGWETVCLLDDGRNIHKQDFDLAEEYLPHMKIDALSFLRKDVCIE